MAASHGGMATESSATIEGMPGPSIAGTASSGGDSTVRST